jgi:hypothetical protein
MASFEDYDEFGNYIGADLGSDVEEDPSQAGVGGDPAFQPFEETNEEPLEGFTEDGPATAAMELDGEANFHDYVADSTLLCHRTLSNGCDTT